MNSRRTSLFAAAFGVISVALAAATLQPAQADPVQFSIGSFNIHNPASTGCASWSTRGPWIAKHIVDRKLNVVGVQEAYQAMHRTELLDYINNEAERQWGAGVRPYAMTFPADQTASIYDADYPYRGYDNRLIYDTRKVELKGTWAKEFAVQTTSGRTGRRHMVWAVFKHRTSGRPFLVFTTHLEPGNDAVDQKQWTELLGYAKSKRDYFTNLYQATVPVFAIGDYNTTKFEGAAATMLANMRNAGIGDILGQQYRTYTTYAARVASGSGNAYINSYNHCDPDTRKYRVATNRNGNSPDYIFASNYLKGPNGGAIPYYEYVGFGTYPFLRSPIPSDHFLITATVVLP